MESSLLDKTRKLNRLLQKTSPQSVVFSDICEILSEVLNSDVLIINKKGKVLGVSNGQKSSLTFFGRLKIKDVIDETLNIQLLNVESTQTDMKINGVFKELLNKYYSENDIAVGDNVLMTMVPINGGGERLGTLLIYSKDKNFNEEDLVLTEYGSTVVGMEILISKQEELRIRQVENETEIKKKAIVQLAIGTLSYSELEAIIHIFNELDGNEGLLVASKIADRAKITRSVIVNALRKFESAGLIEARSLGMKGTHIKVLNEKLFEELKKISSKE